MAAEGPDFEIAIYSGVDCPVEGNVRIRDKASMAVILEITGDSLLIIEKRCFLTILMLSEMESISKEEENIFITNELGLIGLE